jgi:hypothetical protein
MPRHNEHPPPPCQQGTSSPSQAGTPSGTCASYEPMASSTRHSAASTSVCRQASSPSLSGSPPSSTRRVAHGWLRPPLIQRSASSDAPLPVAADSQRARVTAARHAWARTAEEAEVSSVQVGPEKKQLCEDMT